MPTIRDIAVAANVSIATVSRVLNESESVSAETRARVQAAIKALNYRPDPIARRLSMGRTFTIGVILPFLTRPSYVERLRGIEAAVSHTEYDLVIQNVETRTKRDASFAELPSGRRFDGLVIISLAPTDAEAEAFVASHLPVVLVDCAHPRLSSVSIDNYAGGRLVAEYLLSQGHRQLAFIGDLDNDALGFRSRRDRLAGFTATLAAHDVPLLPQNILVDEHGRREAKHATATLLHRPPAERPTAVFAYSDIQALGVLDALREAGLQAPDDLAVIGFDDIEIAEVYGLTTVRQPLYDSGVQGIELLWKHIAAPEAPPAHTVLPLTLVTRQTA